MKLAERHRHAVAPDDPRLVDGSPLVGARSCIASATWPVALTAARPEPVPPSAVRIAVSDPGCDGRVEHGGNVLLVVCGRVELTLEQRFQPPSATIATTAAMRRTHVPREVLRAARFAFLGGREGHGRAGAAGAATGASARHAA